MNVGLIGCGRAARVHMDVHRRLNTNVIAVADISLERARVFAEPYKIERVYSDYKDLLEIKDLDFVDVCTPTSTHVSVVCDVAKFGHDVLVEKPMARNTLECEKMIDECKRQSVRLGVCHNQLFLPSVKQLESIVNSGRFDMISFRTANKESFQFLKAHGFAQNWNISPEERGILWEVGPHLAYLQLHFLQSIKEVYALGAKSKYPVYDDFTVLLKSKDERYGILEVSWLSKEREIVYEIADSDGRRMQAHLPHDYLIEKSSIPPEGVIDVLRSFYLDEKRIFKKWINVGMTHFKKPTTGHFELIEKYVESLERNLSPPVSANDGKRTIRLLECIEESLNEGKPVAYSL